MAGVSIRGLSKRYGAVEAVRDVSLDVADGEFLVLLGASGSGKSTVLKILAGIEEADSGEVWLDDVRVDTLLPGSRDMAMVFQSYALYPHMSVARNLGFPLRSAGVHRSEVRRRVEEVAALLGLTELLGRRPAQLSGGQQQRVALGRALVRQPKAFLMDEPLSNLDAKLRTRTRLELARLHARLGITTVYVTHDQVEAMTMGDRIAVMDNGVLHQVDPPEVIYDFPADLMVADFLGSPPMNLVPVSCAVTPGCIEFSGAGIELKIAEGPLHQAVRAELQARGSSGSLVLGIRPEFLRLGSGSTGNSIAATVERVEMLGNERVVHLRAGTTALAARVPVAIKPAVGESVSITVEVSGIRVFDAVSGQLLGR
ncbi:MAG: ABC transporter ATP-binding protein [Nocardioidaceae bacterium]